MSTIDDLITKSEEATATLETTVNFADSNVYTNNANTASPNKQSKEFITLPQINNTDFNRGLLGIAFDTTPKQSTSSFAEVEMYNPTAVSNPASLTAVAELATANCYQATSYRSVRFNVTPAKESRISETISDITLATSFATNGNLESLIAKHSRSTTYQLSRVINAKLYSGSSTSSTSQELVGVKSILTKFDVAVTGTATAGGSEGYYANKVAYTVPNTNLFVQSVLATHNNRVTEQQVTKAVLIVPTNTGVLLKKYFRDQSDTAPIAVYNIDGKTPSIDPFGKGTAYSMFADMGDRYQVLADLWIVESKDQVANEAIYLPIEVNGIPAITNEYIGNNVVRTALLYNGDGAKEQLLNANIPAEQLELTASLPCDSFAIKKTWYGFIFFNASPLGRIWTNAQLLTSTALPTSASTIPTFTNAVNLYA